MFEVKMNETVQPCNVTAGSELSSYEKNKTLFWCFASVCVVIAVIGIIGNGLVMYVSHQTRNTGRLRYLDSVVNSLAVTDFLFGLVGIPLVITSYYLGKS